MGETTSVLPLKVRRQLQLEEAVKWLRKAADQGLAEAQTNLAFAHRSGEGVVKSHAEAVKWYRKAAEQGHAAALNSLGNAYLTGQGVVKNDEEAVKWYRKAAEQGHAAALKNLGRAFDNGKGVEKNSEEAAKWYRKAAEHGNSTAKKTLAVLESKSAKQGEKRRLEGGGAAEVLFSLIRSFSFVLDNPPNLSV